MVVVVDFCLDFFFHLGGGFAWLVGLCFVVVVVVVFCCFVFSEVSFGGFGGVCVLDLVLFTFVFRYIHISTEHLQVGYRSRKG